MHGDLNENERIDTDITETQQWKVRSRSNILHEENIISYGFDV